MNEITQNDVVAIGEVVVDVGKVLELEARRPLSPPAPQLMQGQRAEGVRSGRWWREGRRRREGQRER
jgi:hypothetical protein